MKKNYAGQAAEEDWSSVTLLNKVVREENSEGDLSELRCHITSSLIQCTQWYLPCARQESKSWR